MKSQPNRTIYVPGLAFLLGALLCVASAGAAQQVPSPDQAKQALQAAQGNPALIAQLRARLQASGMSPDQIRARLAASGYPPDLLDSYLGSAQSGQAAPTPGPDQLAALEALGLGTTSLSSDSLHADTGMIRMEVGISAED